MFNSYRRRDPFTVKTDKISDPDMNGSVKKRWVEESWSRDEINGQAPLKEFLGLSLSPRRIFGAGGLIFLTILIFLGRLFYLQIWKGDEYRRLAENNRLRFKPILAERGLIYDRNLIPLVANLPNFSLNLIPQALPPEKNRREEIFQKISRVADVPVEEIEKQMEEFKTFSFRSLTLRGNLDYQTAALLTIAAADLPGVEIETGSRRHYSFTEKTAAASKTPSESVSSLSHVLGYMGKVNKDDLVLNPNYLPTDFIGKTGLEKFYERNLRGVLGKKEIEVDALGKEKNVVAQEPPRAGDNLILSIDLAAQKKLEEILASELKTGAVKRAAAVALNPQNGEIIALVNLPSFDNNLFSQGITQTDYQKLLIDPNAPLFPRAWAGNYPSGSTIKPVIAAAALNEGLINRYSTFLSSGGLQINRWFFPDWKEGGHGPTDVVKALAESVNTFFYFIGGGYQNFTGLGLEKITEYLKKFGLANTSGLDLPNEAAGFIPSKEWKEDSKKENWYIGDTYNLSIGQGDLLVTPLQVANYTAAIANGGTLYQPRLLYGWLAPDGQKIPAAPRPIEKEIVPDSFLKIVRQGLREAVVYGSARSLSELPLAVAGKTGTAQWSNNKPTHAWFTGFAPYENPKLVLTVLIEEGGEGSRAAVPVAKRFFQWWLKEKINN